MSPETGKKAVDFLIKSSGPRKHLEMDFFGGEPLINMKTVKAVTEYARKREQETGKKFKLTLTTNGQRLTELAAPLRAAGLDRLNISLDTLRPERYRARTRGGELDRVLEGIAAAEAAGFRDLRLNAVLLRGVNDDELRDLALLAKEHPWSVRFIELMPIGPGAGLSDAFLPAEAVLKAVPELREMQSAKCKAQNEATGNRQQATEKAFPLGTELSGGQRDFITICAAELRKGYPTRTR